MLATHLETPEDRAEFRGAIWRDHACPVASRPLRAADYLNWLAAMEIRRRAERPELDFESFLTLLYLHPTET